MTVSAGPDSKTPKAEYSFLLRRSHPFLLSRPLALTNAPSRLSPIQSPLGISLIIIQRFYTHCVYTRECIGHRADVINCSAKL